MRWFFVVLLCSPSSLTSSCSLEREFELMKVTRYLRTRKKDKREKNFVFLKFLSSFSSSLFFGFCLILCQTPKHTLKYSLSERRRESVQPKRERYLRRRRCRRDGSRAARTTTRSFTSSMGFLLFFFLGNERNNY